MGNRAVITTKENFENNGIGIYLHWNGGRDSIEAFLKYCELRNFRSPDTDCYGWARLTQIIANFFGMDGLSVGIDTVDHLDCDNFDNGVYFIEGWKIVGREYFSGAEQDEYKMCDMLKAIDDAQPEPLGDYLTAEIVPVSDLKVGDKVYFRKWNNSIKVVTIVGFGEDIIVNGHNVKGLPFAEIVNDSRDNPNNYIYDSTVRKAV
jgi:hypothetical protein